MFENVQFSSHLHLKYAKSAIMTQKNFFLKISLWVSKKYYEFEISIKFCVFFIPIMIFFKKKFFLVIIALFAYFKCKCEKNCTFSNILQKVKSFFFANSYHFPFDSY
jgi:hypothetical protein